MIISQSGGILESIIYIAMHDGAWLVASILQNHFHIKDKMLIYEAQS